mmetsp:Transcript_13191/g.27009  ORF Transcript_13191/g.27009 Transcript_13191/m.27009 type:complete len:1152 (+) Transcript_13191:786-4241(+)
MLSTEEFPTLLEEGAVPVRQIPRELISEPASLPVSRDPSINDLLHLEGDSDDDNEDSHHLDGAFSGHKRDRCGDGNNYNDTGGDGIHGHRSSQTSNTDSNTDSNGHGINSNSVRSTEGLGLTDCPSRNSLVHQEELRCVIAVVRHADRTPKEKIKLNTNEPIILKYFTDHSTGSSQDNKTCQDNSNKQQQQQPTKDLKDLKIKAKGHMTEFLTAVRKIIASYEEKKDLGKNDEKIMWKFKHMRDVLVRWKFSGLNRKLQLKPKKIATDDVTGVKTVKEVQLILKWGGDLTKLGENQAIKLGQQFRHSIYPDSPGGGVLRLHSTFRHDLKIKTSDEGRVMKTAAAFAKGLLDLEGDIPPILVSLVHKEKGSMHMLDPSGDKDVKLELDECKEKISQHLQEDIDWRDMTEEDRIRLVGPPMVTSLRDALAKIGNPRKALQTIYETMATLIEELEEMWSNLESGDEKTTEESDNEKKESEDADAQLSGVKLYKGETLLELTERWRFIYQRMYDDETKMFDLSRIPDVLDNVRFDVLHNPHLGLTSVLHKLYSLAKDMADTVVPQEYGTTLAEKRSVGIKVCSPLLEKIRDDLQIARTDNKTDMRYLINMDYSADLPITTMGRRIRTRLYFTSESHLHTLINVLRFAGDNCSSGSTSNGSSPVLSPYGMEFLNESKEVCYLTQVVIRLFEDTGRRMSHPRRYRVEILFSAGATGTPIHQCKSTKEADSTRLDTDHLVAVGREGLTCQEVEEFFDSIIAERGQTDTSHDLRLSMKPSDLLLGSPKAPLSNSNNNNTEPSKSNPMFLVQLKEMKDDLVRLCDTIAKQTKNNKIVSDSNSNNEQKSNKTHDFDFDLRNESSTLLAKFESCIQRLEEETNSVNGDAATKPGGFPSGPVSVSAETNSNSNSTGAIQQQDTLPIPAAPSTPPSDGKGGNRIDATSTTTTNANTAPLSLRDCILQITKKNDPLTLKTGSQLLYLYLANLSGKPDNRRYRKMFVSNESFRKVDNLVGGKDLLKAVGFVEDPTNGSNGGVLEWVPTGSTEQEIAALVLVKEAAAALGVLKNANLNACANGIPSSELIASALSKLSSSSSSSSNINIPHPSSPQQELLDKNQHRHHEDDDDDDDVLQTPSGSSLLSPPMPKKLPFFPTPSGEDRS